MTKDTVFKHTDGFEYKIQSIEAEWVRATKLVNGKPQKGRPAKLARPLVEAVFNPLGLPVVIPVATQSGVSTVTSTTSATAPVVNTETDAEAAAKQAAKEADNKRFIAESLKMMKDGGGVDLNKEPGQDEISLPDEEVTAEVEDLSKVFE